MEQTSIFKLSTSIKEFRVGYSTDIGGGEENQDDYLIYENGEHNISVFGIFDGHNKENGKIAAISAKDKLIEFINENLLLLKSNPVETIRTAYIRAHENIKQNLKDAYIKEGYTVIETPDGYLIKRKSIYIPWSCIHGGSTCTIIIIVDNIMYISNVGDSSALLYSVDPELDENDIQYITDCAYPTKFINDNIVSSDLKKSDTIKLTSDHSPENIREFYRIRDHYPNPREPLKPYLQFIYDKYGYPKCYCPNLFNIDNCGIPSLTNEGKYHKTVRGDFATYIITPLSSQFTEQLAFTRTLGDFQLQKYGVSHLPEIKSIDLDKLFKKVTSPLCIVIASDGVWDNWLYEDVTKFITESNRVEKVFTDKNGCQEITDEFMKLNQEKARTNFGNTADNATSIIVYISNKI